ncbi:MAG TPA: hypothetical protein VJT81_06640 [Burkholderiales bacterium]|nr:hypothetical protein [Burkholderiales bacterium]
MSRQMWSETLFWATADGTAVANTTTETIVFPNVTIPANYMADGRVLRLRASGKLSTTGTPTITFAIRWGGVAGTLLATTEAITCASGAANTAWELDAIIQTRANGATGSLLVIGRVTVNLTASTNTHGVFGVSGFDAPAAVTADLTVDTALSLTADWSAASASNTLTGMIYTGESLN